MRAARTEKEVSSDSRQADVGRSGWPPSVRLSTPFGRGFVDFIDVGENLKAFQERRCSQAFVQSNKTGSPGMVFEPEESGSQLQRISGPQWMFEKKILRAQANLFGRLDFKGTFSKAAEFHPASIQCLSSNLSLAIDASQCAYALHWSRPPEEQIGVLLKKLQGLP